MSTSKISLTSEEDNLKKKVLHIMKKQNSNYFYMSYLFNTKDFNLKTAELILKLVKKKVLNPLE